MSSCYSSLGPKEKPYTWCSIMSCLAFCLDWTCDWVSELVMFNPNPLCIDSISFPSCPKLIRSILTNQSNQFMSGNLSEFSLTTYSVFLLIVYTPMLFPSPPLGRWWKTLPTIFRRIWLVRPRPHTKYYRAIYPNIPSSFNYSSPYGVPKGNIHFLNLGLLMNWNWVCCGVMWGSWTKIGTDDGG